MIKSWTSFLLAYIFIGSIPSIILLVRGYKWRWSFFAISQAVTWTGGGWMIMVWLAVVKKRPSFSLYFGKKQTGDRLEDQ